MKHREQFFLFRGITKILDRYNMDVSKENIKSVLLWPDIKIADELKFFGKPYSMFISISENPEKFNKIKKNLNENFDEISNSVSKPISYQNFKNAYMEIL